MSKGLKRVSNESLLLSKSNNPELKFGKPQVQQYQDMFFRLLKF
jgi:hypothetical protein